MRNPLNKTRTIGNEVTRQETKADNVTPAVPMDSMNPRLQQIMARIQEIGQTKPGTSRDDLLKGIEKARAAQKAAEEAKEAAETEEDFDKACEDAIRAREKEMFFLRLLENLDFTPRMSEEEYMATVSAVDDIVREAAADFCATAERIMPELVRGKRNIDQTIRDADKVLTALDASSRYLQNKYRYRKTEYTDGTEEMTEDPNEWLNHTRRYGNGRAYDYIFIKAIDGSKWPPEQIRNESACAAWVAAERMSK